MLPRCPRRDDSTLPLSPLGRARGRAIVAMLVHWGGSARLNSLCTRLTGTFGQQLPSMSVEQFEAVADQLAEASELQIVADDHGQLVIFLADAGELAVAS